MAWTTPKTWASEPLTSADLNTYNRDNMEYLKSRTDADAAQYIRASSDYTTTSTSYVDMDTTNLNLTITTTGGDVAITFVGYGGQSGNQNLDIAFRLDDTTDYEIFAIDRSSGGYDTWNYSFTYILTGLSAGSHNFKMRWKVSGGTGTMYAGNLLFDVREITGEIS